MAEFRMPSLGADMESGILVEWLIKPGDRVKRGDLVAVVETQKGQIDVEIFDSGVVQAILVEEGTEVPVGTPLAIVNGRRPEEAAAPAALVVAPRSPAASQAHVIEREAVSPQTAGARLRVSPAARRLAEELGVDLSAIAGSGPEGAITLADVQQAPAASAAPPRPATDPQAEMRRAIATSMARSKREIPHYYLSSEIDMASASEWLTEENTRRPVTERLLYAALLLKAVALSVREVPEMNGYWEDDRFDQRQAVHLGVAISLRGGGLVAPAIHDADQCTLDEIMAKLRDLVQRARTGRLRSSEISEATITVTNLGEQGVDQVFGVIYPPQVALVGFGALARRPRAVGDQILIRPAITASLSADHRASVGHRGAQFLAAIGKLLQEPEKL
jgi:pyruvate dehydrogenase E2 component (dihydrolipoamide acetyltransferase)